MDIRIAEDYVYDMSQRPRTYKRISSAESEEELADVQAEIADRHGPIPATVENLFKYSRLRREGDRLAVELTEQAKIDPDKLIAMVSEGSASFAPSGVLKIRLDSQDDAAVFDEVRDLLNRLH